MSTELLPTPETDAATAHRNDAYEFINPPEWEWVVTSDFARKLERERDTLRRLLDRCRHVNGLPYELYADIQEALNCDASTFPFAGFIWTKHKPGDSMPCDGDARVSVLLQDSRLDGAKAVRASMLYWGNSPERMPQSNFIIGWRYAGERGE